MSHKVATSTDPFAASRRLADATGLGPLRHVQVTGSTNFDLVSEARAGDFGSAVLVADHQKAGRGRLARRWDDDIGNSLLVSIRVPVKMQSAFLIVAAVGVAARSAADQLTTSAVLTKWPNDLVVVDGSAPGKLGGILAESVASVSQTAGDLANVAAASECVVVGVGINISAIKRQRGATSMFECGMDRHHGTASRDLLLSRLLGELAKRLKHPATILPQLRAHSATLKTRVRVELPGNSFVVGEAVEIDDLGQLILRRDDNRIVTITAGDVIHLRSAAS